MYFRSKFHFASANTLPIGISTIFILVLTDISKTKIIFAIKLSTDLPNNLMSL
jgi:phosphate starvation-inducible membrane PsiE